MVARSVLRCAAGGEDESNGSGDSVGRGESGRDDKNRAERDGTGGGIADGI
jgi:hypothetical protein